MTRAVRLIFALLVCAAPVVAADAKPNIVYILADDMGYGDVGAYNSESKIPTPAIDALASAGMRFTDAHTGSAVCTPTRYGILTGRYAWRSRLKRGVLHGYDEPLIEDGRLTVPALLKQNGYTTACIGKWHLGLGWKKSGESVDFTQPVTAGPNTVGFDESFIIPASLDMPPYVYIDHGKLVELPTARVEDSPRPKMWRAGPIAPSLKFENVVHDLTTKAESFIERSAPGAKDGKPFFLYLPLTSPHTPHVPSAKFAGKSALGPYGDFMMETDASIGRIIEALKRHGLTDNTLIILTSDNGPHSEPLKLEQHNHRSGGQWRGQKSDVWEAGHRVPFIVRWPARVKPGKTSDQTICSTDLMATLAEIVSAKLPDDAAEDSASFLGQLTGSTNDPVRDGTVHHSGNGTFAIRQGDWKLLLCRGSGGWSLPEKEAKELPTMQLYNLRDDPSEMKNLVNDRPEIAERLQALLTKYQTDSRSVPKRQ